MENILNTINKTELSECFRINLSDNLEKRVQENLTRWQSTSNDASLAPLDESRLDLIYQMRELLNKKYFTSIEGEKEDESMQFERIDNLHQFYIAYDKMQYDMVNEDLLEYDSYGNYLHKQGDCTQDLLSDVNEVSVKLDSLSTNYNDVAGKINALHNVSENLMRQQSLLKEKTEEINNRLIHFTRFNTISHSVNTQSYNLNGPEFIDILDQINTSMQYLETHSEYKESFSYKLRYEQLLAQCLAQVVRYVNSIVVDATQQVLLLGNNQSQAAPAIPAPSAASSGSTGHTAFSYYYGKFLNAAGKTSRVIRYVEDHVATHDTYERSLGDFYKSYFSQRAPVMQAAVGKALLDLRDKYKTDHGVLFRSASLFIIKVCQDEDACYKYFFQNESQQLKDYLYSICQNLYDVLRPRLIGINHIEVLTELCTVLKEMTDTHSGTLNEFIDIANQLLQDVKERLVFCTSVFFQYDINSYEPSPGDIAYPEKLEQMEAVALSLDPSTGRSDSRSSSISEESQEVAKITSSTVGQFRSFTGNSPADLHGMWYPTVKRTLVCLSRLYICLDRETFQGVAQESLLICVKTIQKAATAITARKTQLDALLFQIKHLLIIREQIAPFQVDFTAKELVLDFSHMRSAAVGLVHNRSKIFKLDTNNAILEFLLEGTPRVKEYLVDSRKEIDKQLKATCEQFIAHCTNTLLIGSLVQALRKADAHLKLVENFKDVPPMREYMTAQALAGVCTAAQRSIKTKIPDVQKSMRLYLANRETEFILFRPIKNNIINSFMQLEQLLTTGKYNQDDILLVGCPTTEQLNVLVSSVSLAAADSDHQRLRN